MSGVPFHLPHWAGTPPKGPILEIIKNEMVNRKRRIDRRPYYLFGRKSDSVDILIQHGSCSRIHAALVFHAEKEQYALIDLRSTHGTFIGDSKTKLKPYEPAVIPFGSVFRFGASTRSYVIRENGKNAGGSPIDCDLEDRMKTLDLDTATQSPSSVYDGTPESIIGGKKRKRPEYSKSKSVSFDLADEILTVDDVDWSFKHYRNLGSSKRRRLDLSPDNIKTTSPSPYVSEFEDSSLSPTKVDNENSYSKGDESPWYLPSYFEKLQLPSPRTVEEGLRKRGGSVGSNDNPNPYANASGSSTPPIDLDDDFSIPPLYPEDDMEEPMKKKYPKEKWPRVKDFKMETSF